QFEPITTGHLREAQGGRRQPRQASPDMSGQLCIQDRNTGQGCGVTVLVTGGAGYIGSHMVWELLDAGERVVVVDNLSKGFDWAVAPEALLVKGDIADTDLVGGLIREHAIDAVIHFAGSIVVPESVADPLAYYRNNTCKTRTLIET